MSDIRTLLDSRPGPSAIPQLQAHVAAQAKGDAPYLFDSVRMLVKLHQLFPDTTANSSSSNVIQESMALSCLLALSQYPNMTEFLALVYMIPPNIMASEPCASIQACADTLDACQYTEFWSLLAKLQTCEMASVAALAKLSVSAFQSGMLTIFSLTYRQAPASVVLAALQVDSLDKIAALKHAAVESVAGNTVSFQSTSDNTKREHVFQESVGFTAITSLMSKLAQ